MTSLLLAPHNDDETLFAAFTIQRYRPHVVICLRSAVQEERYGITAQTRESETLDAMMALLGSNGGMTCEQWGFLDSDSFYVEYERMDRLRGMMRTVDQRLEPEAVFAPALEDGGHEQHNLIGMLAREVFGARLVPYLTYRRGEGKSRQGTEVVPEPDMIERKLRALACYRSQMTVETGCQPWFLGDLREYLA